MGGSGGPWGWGCPDRVSRRGEALRLPSLQPGLRRPLQPPCPPPDPLGRQEVPVPRLCQDLLPHVAAGPARGGGMLRGVLSPPTMRSHPGEGRERAPCCAVPHCAVLHRAVPCCAMPCCAVPCCTVLCCTVLCCTVLHHTVPCHAVLHRAVPCHAMLHHAVLHRAVPYRAVLHSAVLHRAMLRSAMQCHAAPCWAMPVQHPKKEHDSIRQDYLDFASASPKPRGCSPVPLGLGDTVPSPFPRCSWAPGRILTPYIAGAIKSGAEHREREQSECPLSLPGLSLLKGHRVPPAPGQDLAGVRLPAPLCVV